MLHDQYSAVDCQLRKHVKYVRSTTVVHEHVGQLHLTVAKSPGKLAYII